MTVACLIFGLFLFQINLCLILLSTEMNWDGVFFIVEMLTALETARVLKICIFPASVRSLLFHNLGQFSMLSTTEKLL